MFVGKWVVGYQWKETVVKWEYKKMNRKRGDKGGGEERGVM
ncbi:YfkD family protein [Bacillus velezensis]